MLAGCKKPWMCNRNEEGPDEATAINLNLEMAATYMDGKIEEAQGKQTLK
jgi:hypothetical protein